MSPAEQTLAPCLHPLSPWTHHPLHSGLNLSKTHFYESSFSRSRFYLSLGWLKLLSQKSDVTFLCFLQRPFLNPGFNSKTLVQLKISFSTCFSISSWDDSALWKELSSSERKLSKSSVFLCFQLIILGGAKLGTLGLFAQCRNELKSGVQLKHLIIQQLPSFDR